MGIWKIAMEIITDEIANLKSAWKKTSEQQLFHELEIEYGFPRATCRSLVQLMHEFIGQNYGNQREDKRTINTFGQHQRYCAGVATPDPGEAPPMAGYNVRSLFS